MRIDPVRLTFRALAVAAVAALAATGIAACGDSDDEAQTVAVSVKEAGDTAVFSGAPSSVEAGLVELQLTNDGERPHDVQLLRVEGDHSPEEVIEAAGQAFQGRPFPDWFFAAGGITITAPGKSSSTIEVFEPGTYYLADTGSGPPDPNQVTSIKVTGEASDAELPETDATISAIDYGFETDGELKAGKNEITFENTGAQPHHIVAEQISEGKTIEDVQAYLKSEKGPPPFEEEGTTETAALDAGGSQNVTLNLKAPGTYALLCFISDRQGGPPHSIGEGMIGEAEVE